MAAQAHDFAPDLLTVQLSPPSRVPRTAVLGLTALVAGMLAWSFWAELDIVATAQGRLVPISYTKVVQPAEGGVVSDILVKDGDAVKAGQVLLRLDARLSQTDLLAQGQDVAIKRMTLSRIAAELAAVDSDNAAAPVLRLGKRRQCLLLQLKCNPNILRVARPTRMRALKNFKAWRRPVPRGRPVSRF